MELTSDGRIFVYVVMGADGCECESLEAIFETKKEAVAYVARIQSEAQIVGNIPERQWKEADCYGNPDLLTVERIELGKKRDVLAHCR